jgi:hypothetical protein
LACLSFVQEEEALPPNARLAFPKFPSRGIWPCVTSLRLHEPGELRLGEGQQRADGFGFDIEHPCHGGGFHPLVAKPQGDRVAGGEGFECAGTIHALTLRIDVRERLGTALPIFRGDAGLP